MCNCCHVLTFRLWLISAFTVELLTPFHAGWPANLHLKYSAFPVERDYEYSTIPIEPNIFISGLEILTFK